MTQQIPTWRLFVPVSLFVVSFLATTFLVSRFAHKNLPLSMFFGMIITCVAVIVASYAHFLFVNLVPLPGREDVLIADEEPGDDR